MSWPLYYFLLCYFITSLFSFSANCLILRQLHSPHSPYYHPPHSRYASRSLHSSQLCPSPPRGQLVCECWPVYYSTPPTSFASFISPQLFLRSPRLKTRLLSLADASYLRFERGPTAHHSPHSWQPPHSSYSRQSPNSSQSCRSPLSPHSRQSPLNRLWISVGRSSDGALLSEVRLAVSEVCMVE
eukprot:GHVN01009189.1.p1 GENE.GHVN01009189.1~~GHVN01009189.1.p1  ORF type:complete len:185 (+),score=72.14 GHVN01009189.1:61-615(+)